MLGVTCWSVAHRHTRMVNVSLPEIRGIVCQRLRQTGMSSHYGPRLGHDSAPRLGPNFGLVDAKKKDSLPLHHPVSDSANPHYVSDPLPQPL
jgi:hypothetical protein